MLWVFAAIFRINGQMLLTDRGRDLIAVLPSDRLLTETDGPFTQVSGRAACPADVTITVETIANLRRTTQMKWL